MRLFSVFSRVPSGIPLRAPLKLTCHSPSLGEWAAGGKITKSVLAASRRSGDRRQSAHNIALTDVHLILTVVFPQMEMFFLLAALRCDEVVGLLFVTRSDVLWMSCAFILFTFRWDCFVSSAGFVCSGNVRFYYDAFVVVNCLFDVLLPIDMELFI